MCVSPNTKHENLTEIPNTEKHCVLFIITDIFNTVLKIFMKQFGIFFLLLIFASSWSLNPLGPYKVSGISTSGNQVLIKALNRLIFPSFRDLFVYVGYFTGVSSGGYMAVQLHISHSSIINGSAIFAGVRVVAYFITQIFNFVIM